MTEIPTGEAKAIKRYEWALETLKVAASLAMPLIIFLLGQDLTRQDQTRQSKQWGQEQTSQARQWKLEFDRRGLDRKEDNDRKDAQDARQNRQKEIDSQLLADRTKAQSERDERVRLAAIAREQAALDLEIRKQATLDDERIYAQQQVALKTLTESMFRAYNLMKVVEEKADLIMAKPPGTRDWKDLKPAMANFQKASVDFEPERRASLNVFRRFMIAEDFDYVEKATIKISKKISGAYGCYSILSTEKYRYEIGTDEEIISEECKYILKNSYDCINDYSWSVSGKTIKSNMKSAIFFQQDFLCKN